MKNRLDKYDEKLDKLADGQVKTMIQLEKISVDTERNTDSLIEHSARTKANEDRIQKLEEVKIFILGAFWVVGSLFALFQAYLKFHS